MDEFHVFSYKISTQLLYGLLNQAAVLLVLLFIALCSVFKRHDSVRAVRIVLIRAVLRVLYNFKEDTQQRNKLRINVDGADDLYENLSIVCYMHANFLLYNWLFLLSYMVFKAHYDANDSLDWCSAGYECYARTGSRAVLSLNLCTLPGIRLEHNVQCFKYKIRPISGYISNCFTALGIALAVLIVNTLMLDLCAQLRRRMPTRYASVIALVFITKAASITFLWFYVLPATHEPVTRYAEFVAFSAYYSLTYSSTLLHILILRADDLCRSDSEQVKKTLLVA